jgi:hypothetical protein
MRSNWTYCIIDASEVSTLDFSELEQNSASTLRYSLDNSKTLVKYEGSQPSALSGKTEYSHAEIRVILQDYDEGWTEQDPS